MQIRQRAANGRFRPKAVVGSQPISRLVRVRLGGTLPGLKLWRSVQGMGRIRRSGLVAAKPRALRPQRFGGAVGAAPDCPAVRGLAAASRNSLRSLRSLRSDKRDENVGESRCARGRKPCASRRPTGALQPERTRLCRDLVGVRAFTGSEYHKRNVAPGEVLQMRVPFVAPSEPGQYELELAITQYVDESHGIIAPDALRVPGRVE